MTLLGTASAFPSTPLARADDSARARGSDFARLCRTVREAGLLTPAPAGVRHPDRRDARVLCVRLRSHRVARELVVPAARRGRARHRLHPGRLPRPRRRPPADLRQPARNDVLGPHRRQPARRAELRLVGRQAQPAPREPEPRGPRPRHRRRRRSPSPPSRPRPGPVARSAVHHAPPGLVVLPAAHPRGHQPARRQRPVAA